MILSPSLINSLLVRGMSLGTSGSGRVTPIASLFANPVLSTRTSPTFRLFFSLCAVGSVLLVCLDRNVTVLVTRSAKA